LLSATRDESLLKYRHSDKKYIVAQRQIRWDNVLEESKKHA